MSQNDKSYSEKRDFIRMRLETAVTMQYAGQNYPALCMDLSSTGMQLEADATLAVGDRVRVLIPSEHPELNGLDAEAEVVRIHPAENGRQSIGLTIIAMH